MKHLGKFAGMVVVAAVLFLVALFGESGALGAVVSGGLKQGTSLEDWIGDFIDWRLAGAVAGVFAAFLWYVLGQWVLRVEHPVESERRPVWLVLAVIPALAALVGLVEMRTPAEGGWLMYVFMIYGPILCYYLCTALFSPSSYRDTPLGAAALRRLTGR